MAFKLLIMCYTNSVYNIDQKYFLFYLDYNINRTIFAHVKTNNLYNTGKLTRDKKAHEKSSAFFSSEAKSAS